MVGRTPWSARDALVPPPKPTRGSAADPGVRPTLFWALIALAPLAWSDAGVLIPSTAKQPDPKVLTLDEMSISVVIDNGNAKVKVQQIFANHTSSPIEGNYVFALPGRALISDFAIWDDATRIPGVILERKRAEEIYNDIRMQALDPGLL